MLAQYGPSQWRRRRVLAAASGQRTLPSVPCRNCFRFQSNFIVHCLPRRASFVFRSMSVGRAENLVCVFLTLLGFLHNLYVRCVVFFPATASVPKPRVARRCVCTADLTHEAKQNAAAVENSTLSFKSPDLNEKTLTASTQAEVIAWAKRISNPQQNALFCAQFHPWNNSWLVYYFVENTALPRNKSCVKKLIASPKVLNSEICFGLVSTQATGGQAGVVECSDVSDIVRGDAP